MKRLQTLILVLILGLLTACGDDDATNGGADQRDPRLQRPLGDQSIVGRAIYQNALPWSPIFVQDIVENDLDLLLSTVTNADGSFRLLGVFNRAGMVSTFPTPNAEEPMYSLYSALPNDPATRVNITPVTDALTRIYLWNRHNGLMADSCYYDAFCAQMLNASFQHAQMELYLNNLRTWLGPWWTADNNSANPPIQPFTTPLETGDPMAAMLRALRFRVYEAEIPKNSTDPESPLVNAKFLSVCNANLELTINVRDLANPDYVRPDDLLATSPCAPDPTTTSIAINLDANPANGPAPLTTNISITFPAGEPEGLILQSMLVNPLGQPIAFWTTPTFSVTLTGAGQYRVQTLARADSGAVQAGTSVEVDGPVNDPRFATWGQTGSWRHLAPYENSAINKCEEMLDGSQFDKPTGNQIRHYPEGLCSRTTQFDYPLIGWCSNFVSQKRLYFYRHPQSEINDPLAAQQSREEGRCRGDWTNAP